MRRADDKWMKAVCRAYLESESKRLWAELRSETIDYEARYEQEMGSRLPDVFAETAERRQTDQAPVRPMRRPKKRFAGILTGMAALAGVIALAAGILVSRVQPVVPDSPIAAHPGKETESVTSESSSELMDTPDYTEGENPGGLDGYDPTEGLPICQDIDFASSYIGNDQFKVSFYVPEDFAGEAYAESYISFQSRPIGDLSGQWETIADLSLPDDADSSESTQIIYPGFESHDQIQLPVPVNTLSYKREYRFLRYLHMKNSEKFVLISHLGSPKEFQ